MDVKKQLVQQLNFLLDGLSSSFGKWRSMRSVKKYNRYGYDKRHASSNFYFYPISTPMIYREGKVKDRNFFKKAGIFLFLLSGCSSLAPDYERPNLPVPDDWGSLGTSKNRQKNKNLRLISWKDFFQSPQLQKIIEASLAYNRDLRIAALNVEAARALYRVELANLIPHAKINVNGSEKRDPHPSSLYKANMGASFELDLFGRIQSENNEALESYFATEAAQRAAQIMLITETANAYLQWLADRKLYFLTKSTLKAQKKSYESIKIDYYHGKASDVDLAKAHAAVEKANANLAFYTRRTQQDKNALLMLIGYSDEKVLSFDLKLDDVKLMENLPQYLSSTLLLERPDIVEAEHHLKAANANIGSARAAFFPEISLTGTYGFASSSLKSLFSRKAFGAWSFTPELVLPIFEGGATNSNLDLSEVRKEIAVSKYEKAIQKAFREVADELAAKKTLKHHLQAQHKLVQANQKVYDLSYARYKLGHDSFLSSIDAQHELYEAQKKVIEIQMQCLVNITNLYKALGGFSFL